MFKELTSRLTMKQGASLFMDKVAGNLFINGQPSLATTGWLLHAGEHVLKK